MVSDCSLGTLSLGSGQESLWSCQHRAASSVLYGSEKWTPAGMRSSGGPGQAQNHTRTLKPHSASLLHLLVLPRAGSLLHSHCPVMLQVPLTPMPAGLGEESSSSSHVCIFCMNSEPSYGGPVWEAKSQRDWKWGWSQLPAQIINVRLWGPGRVPGQGYGGSPIYRVMITVGQ